MGEREKGGVGVDAAGVEGGPLSADRRQVMPFQSLSGGTQ
jgi:hypothetical protein